jgi:predicted DNA-binding protein
MAHTKMKRTNFYFPINMLERLKILSKQTGLPSSELLRKAVEDLLTKNGIK